jgi:hypothetical protein
MMSDWKPREYGTEVVFDADFGRYLIDSHFDR